MKRAIWLMAIPIVVVGHNTLYGTRGTFNVYNARCEDMGLLSLNVNSWVYIGPDSMMVIDTLYPGTDTMKIDTSWTKGDVTSLKPIISLSFTPSDYLEFATFLMGRYWDFSNTISYTSPTSDLYRWIGFTAKGGFPFYIGGARKFYIAPGIQGLALIDITHTSAYKLSSSGLISSGFLPWVDFHLNGGYEFFSDTLGRTGGRILIGSALEFTPLKFLNLFIEVTDTVAQKDIGDFSKHVIAVTPGLRIRFGSGIFLSLNLGVALGIQNSPPWNALGGLSIGHDFIKPKKFIVRGKVVDEKTNEPVKDAKVYMEEEPKYVTFTDKDGEFSLETPWPGTLIIEKPGYTTERAKIEKEKPVQIGIERPVPGIVEVTPTAATVRGIVSDANTNEPIMAFIEIHSLLYDTIIPPLTTDPISGYYETSLPAGSYRIEAKAKSYLPKSKSILIKEGEIATIDFHLTKEKIKEIEKEEITIFETIYFERGSVIPTSTSFKALADALRVLKDKPNLKVEITGHTDSVGDRRTNFCLSLRRANWVKDYFVRHGIAPERLKVRSFGEEKPIGDNRTIRGRALNRRVEIKPL